MTTLAHAGAARPWLDASHLLVALPILHVTAGAAYLAGYCEGFGNGINYFLKAEDIFRLALAEMVSVYLTGLVVPLVALGARYASGRPYIDSHLGGMPPGPERDAAASRVESDKKFFQRLILICLGFLTAAAVYKCFREGRLEWFALWMPAVLWTFIGATVLGQRLGLGAVAVSLVTIVVTFIMGAFVSGAIKGQAQESYGFWLASAHGARCSNIAVIRALGDHYLGVRIDGSKVIVDANCTVKFSLPSPGAGGGSEVPPPATRPASVAPKAGAALR